MNVNYLQCFKLFVTDLGEARVSHKISRQSVVRHVYHAKNNHTKSLNAKWVSRVLSYCEYFKYCY